MKLIGTRRKSKHSGTEKSNINDTSNKSKNRKVKASRKKKIIISIVVILATLLFILASLFAIVRWEIQPFLDWFFPLPGDGQLGTFRTPYVPENPVDPNNPIIPRTPDPRYHDEDGEPLPLDKIRNMNIYTFMCFGIDEDGNTDVIMVGAFNTEDYTINIVSIPRDTMMNSPWETRYYEKKANFIQPRMRRDNPNTTEGYAQAMEDALDHFEQIFGFNIDFWFTVNMRGFVALVDSIGGVTFNVPFTFDWTDSSDNTFTVTAGNQRLSGREALAVLRQRYNPSGASLGDPWRIGNQQRFLKSAATQILSSGNIDIPKLAGIFINNARTDIQLDNLIRLGREFVKVDGSNINFETLPGEFIFRYEYMAINVEEWLDIINSKLNPFNFDIEVTDVSILTIDEDRNLYVTDGNFQGSPDWLPNNWRP